MALSIRLLLALVLSCLWCASPWADQSVFPRTLQGIEQKRDLDGEIDLLRDPEGRLSIEEVAAPASQSRFKPLTRGVALGFTRDVAWLRIPLRRAANAPASWRLEAGNAVIDDFQLYAPDADQRYSLILHTGDRQPFSSRLLPYRHPLFPIALPDELTRVYYLRVESASALNVPLRLWQPEALRQSGQRELLLVGLTLGLVGTIALLNLLTWVTIREPKYLIFSLSGLYLFEALVTFLGFTAQHIFPDAPLIVDLLHNINVCLMPAWLLIAMRQAIATPTHHPRLDRWMLWAIAACILAVFSLPFGTFGRIAPFMHIALLLTVFVTAWAAWQAYRRGQPGSLSFLAGALCFLLPASLTTLRALAGFPFTLRWQEETWMLNIVLFSVLMYLGLMLDVLAIREKQLLTERDGQHNIDMANQERRLRDEQTVFFSFVAHELRNPLGVIISGLANLRIGLAGAGTEVNERIARIAWSATHLREVIDRHLRLQRLASADFEPDITDCSPQFPALQALEMIGQSRPERHIEYISAGNLPEQVMLDSELVTLALANLLDNAIKYSPGDACIQLSITRSIAGPERIVYRVTDHGPGIPADEQAQLFRIFTRQHGNAKAGFGIGLALVANIALHHGGEIRCDSAPGAGSTFTMSIPPQPGCHGAIA
ncbi:MAG: sensor histidine kinase [Azonexus sp.]|jgi:signal transduction histidine kinase|nr:sensor histidine kinase [Azonexus sp.]